MLLEGTNSRAAVELLVSLKRDAGLALHRQIETSIREAIRVGRLPRGADAPARAFADFLERGAFDRHRRRMRPLYRRRRDRLVDALREHVPDLEPAGIAAGLHLVAYLPGDLDETTLVDAATRRSTTAPSTRASKYSPRSSPRREALLKASPRE